MKKTVLIPVFILSLFFLAAGCQQAEFEQPVVGTHYLTASIENGDVTKTQLGQTSDGRYFAFWSAKDSLAVYLDGSNTPEPFVLSKGAGTEKGTFLGPRSGRKYVALYPYRDRSSEGLTGETLTLDLPAVQTYSEDSFGEEAFPMLAVAEGSDLSFKNLCAVLKISMTGTQTVKAIRFVSNDSSMPVSGKATVKTTDTKDPKLVMAEGASTEVTLNCNKVKLSENSQKDFFLAIPPGVYSKGFTIVVESTAGSFKRPVAGEVSFSRSMIRALAPFRCEDSGEYDPDAVPSNQLWYVTQDGKILEMQAAYFDRTITSHTYQDGKGVITFDGPLTRVGTDDGLTVFGETTTELYLPNTVEKIGRSAFRFSSISAFRAPNNLKSFGPQAFGFNSLLKKLSGMCATDDGMALVLDGEMVAYAYHELESTLVIPDGITSLAESLFYGQAVIKDVILPDGLQAIGDRCFAYCNNLETVTFSPQCLSVGDYAFQMCPSLREFKGNCKNVHEGRMYIDDKGSFLAYAGKGATECVVPEGVVKIMNHVFFRNKTLRSIYIPSTLETIYTDWVNGCEQLEAFYGPLASEDHHCLARGTYLIAVTPVLPADYTMPDGITNTFYRVFADNKTTERLTLSDGLQALGDGAFQGMAKLRTICLSANLSNMGNDVFQGCNELDTIYFRTYAPPAYQASDFIGHEGMTILVPDGSEDLYKKDAVWSQYASYIKGHKYDDLAAPDYYMSEDYSKDGTVKVLQTASKGKGIDIVLMGDAFSDRQIADGTYETIMRKMEEAIFAEEPYKTYRDYFNVYMVNVVSATEGYAHSGQALGTWFGLLTQIGGSEARCLDYALNAVSQDRMDNTLIIVALNELVRAGGTCYMFDPPAGTDYGCGTSIAYNTVNYADESFANVVRHEAGGHGFAKLDDEYCYESYGSAPDYFQFQRHEKEAFGWYKNIDFTADRSAVKWAHFLADPRYQNEDLGVFEGAGTYWKGAWRPSTNSIMNTNTGGFNAPSREAIWYRIQKLANGDQWSYNYEDFAAYDAVNRKKATTTSTAVLAPAPQSARVSGAPPVAVGKTWKEAMSARSADASADRR